MKQYYIFQINQQISLYYKNKPSVLYKTLDEIYNGSKSDVNFAVRKFKSISGKLNTDNINEIINKSYKNFAHYRCEDNTHIIKDDENEDKITVKNIYIEYETDGGNEFIDVLNDYSDRFFIVDFENGKYCWLREYKKKIQKGGN